MVFSVAPPPSFFLILAISLLRSATPPKLSPRYGWDGLLAGLQWWATTWPPGNIPSKAWSSQWRLLLGSRVLSFNNCWCHECTVGVASGAMKKCPLVQHCTGWWFEYTSVLWCIVEPICIYLTVRKCILPSIQPCRPHPEEVMGDVVAAHLATDLPDLPCMQTFTNALLMKGTELQTLFVFTLYVHTLCLHYVHIYINLVLRPSFSSAPLG